MTLIQVIVTFILCRMYISIHSGHYARFKGVIAPEKEESVVSKTVAVLHAVWRSGQQIVIEGLSAPNGHAGTDRLVQRYGRGRPRKHRMISNERLAPVRGR